MFVDSILSLVDGDLIWVYPNSLSYIWLYCYTADIVIQKFSVFLNFIWLLSNCWYTIFMLTIECTNFGVFSTVQDFVYPEGSGGWLFLVCAGNWHVCPIGFPMHFVCLFDSSLARKPFWFTQARSSVCCLVEPGVFLQETFCQTFSWHFRLNCKPLTVVVSLSHFVFALLGGHLLDCLCLCVLVVPCVASLRVCVVWVSCGVWCIECGCVLCVLGGVHFRLNCKP